VGWYTRRKAGVREQSEEILEEHHNSKICSLSIHDWKQDIGVIRGKLTTALGLAGKCPIFVAYLLSRQAGTIMPILKSRTHLLKSGK